MRVEISLRNKRSQKAKPFEFDCEKIYDLAGRLFVLVLKTGTQKMYPYESIVYVNTYDDEIRETGK